MTEFKPQRYKKLPVSIQAVQYDAGSDVVHSDQGNATDIINWVLSNGGSAAYWCVRTDIDKTEGRIRHRSYSSDDLFTCTPETVDHHTLRIETMEGPMNVPNGHYVIRGVKGEFYSCDPEVFVMTYRHVPGTD